MKKFRGNSVDKTTLDLTDKKIVQTLLQKYGAAPREGWGQNFLISKIILEQILDAADIKKTDLILEVGGGAGTLTHELGSRAKEVTVVEKDPQLIPVLEHTLEGFGNIKIIKADALKLEMLPYSQGKNKWRIIANIPYWITGRFIRLALESSNPPSEIILMVQRELAERICARPPQMSLLSVSVQYYSEPKIIIDNISGNNFWPSSGVNSAVIKINVTRPEPVERVKNKKVVSEAEKFFRVVRAGFAHPRKQLRSNLKNALNLSYPELNDAFAACSIKETARAQELSVDDWRKLAKFMI